MFKSAFIISVLCLSSALARPVNVPPTDLLARQNRGGRNRNGGANTANTATGSRVTAATDGSTIIDDQVVINGLTMRFKISAPDTELIANGAEAGNGTLGLNVLFHGDGGQSFLDFPNQGVNSGLMGVALLSPDPNRRWGGTGRGLDRPDGEAHSAAVNELITNVLPTIVNFDNTKIFMEGVSGGSLLLSGFLLPEFGASLGVPGAVLSCGGLAPEVDVVGDISNMRIHWQSTVDELAELQTSIPQAIAAYEQIASDAGLTDAQINTLQTADASPNGGHCEFDERDFVDGIQLLTDSYANVINGQATLNGVDIINGVVGNENLFGVAGNGAANANAAAATNVANTATGANRNGRNRNQN